MKLCRFTWSAVALLFLASFSALAFGQDAAEAVASAQVSQGSADLARYVVLADLPQFTGSVTTGHVAMPPLRTGISDTAYKALKQAAALSVGSGSLLEGPVAPMAPSSGGSSSLFNTPTASKRFLPPNAAQESNFCNGFIPSDMALAANSTFVVQVTNSCITVLSTSTGLPAAGFPKSLATFFGANPAHVIGDPRALFDPGSNRWIVIAEDFSTAPATLRLAASTGSNPTLGYFIFAIAMGGAAQCGDFPTLGQTLNEVGDARGGIYVGFNLFNCATGAFLGSQVFFLPKTPIYAGAGFGFFIGSGFTLGGVLVDTIQPANVMNKTDRPRAEFMINSKAFNFGVCAAGCNGLVIWAVFKGVPPAGQGPVITGKFVATTNNYTLPPDAQQPGCAGGACLIDTGLTNIKGGVTYSSGELYASLNTRSLIGGAGSSLLMYQIRPVLSDAAAITAATVRSEVCYCTGGGDSAYYGTMQPDSEGNQTTVFNFSGPGNFASVAFTSWRVTQAPNVLHDGGLFLKTGEAFYMQLDDVGRNRWGDYTAGAAAYRSPNSYWFSGQFAQANGNWGTAIGRSNYPNLTTP